MDERKVLFHGTGEDYHNEMVKKYGFYRHEGKKLICLTQFARMAIDYANSNAANWGDRPAILVVYVDRVPDIEIREGIPWPTCHELRPEWYDFVPETRPEINTPSN